MATLIYPSTDYPALAADDVPLLTFVEYMTRITAALTPAEQDTALVKNADTVKIRYTRKPTAPQAIADALVILQAAPAGLDAAAVAALTTLLQNVRKG